jgi:glutathione S-transferase
MTIAPINQPELYWISGSPPSWRVLLGLALKQIPFVSHRLEASKGEHKSAGYLSLNPRGQVPTLTFEGSAIRESIAILAFLDARWPTRLLFGGSPSRAAAVWQAVIEAETSLHTQLATVARILFRGQVKERGEELAAATKATRQELERLERAFELNDFAVDDEPSAADCVLYPSVAWLRRAIDKSSQDQAIPANVARLIEDYPQIAFWCRRVQALPGFEATYPPHWREVEVMKA